MIYYHAEYSASQSLKAEFQAVAMMALFRFADSAKRNHKIA
jgi:hypothetical protein